MKLPVLTLAAALGIFGAALCGAQTPSPPANATNPSTNPSSASSPSQREATRSSANESPATESESSQASTPHQKVAVAGKTQTMKECMDAQSAKNSGMSKSDMTKACEQQMKGQKERAPTSAMPKSSDGSQTPTPK